MATWWDFLALAREERLDTLPDRVIETYRLTINSAWGDNSIIRVERRHNEERDNPDYAGIIVPDFLYRVIAHRLRFEELVESADLEIDKIQWACLEALLQAGQFWRLPESGGHFGIDGADWLVEGNREGQYHCVSRWSPDPDDDHEWLVLPCQYLLDLASLAFLQVARADRGAAPDLPLEPS